VLQEVERTAGGVTTQVLTVFLAGSECPFTCVFCDLWRYTLDEPTPGGAIPRQIERAFEETGPLPESCRLKLYNASNFFDRRAVPAADIPAVARLVAPFSRVVVECHPRLVGGDCVGFSKAIGGTLEVAMGLETVHPKALPRLNKKMSREDYDRAVGELAARGIAHRAFVLVGAPFVPPDAMVDWSVISAAYAMDRGAETVTLIPVRAGNGELDRLAAAGEFRRPTLGEAEAALERSLQLPGKAVVQLDMWDLETLSSCSHCFGHRQERLERINLTGAMEPAIDCTECGGES